MNGEAIVELSNRLLRPLEIGGVIARPNEGTLVDPVSCIKPGPSPQALDVATLGAVRDYLAANKDALDLTHLVVHVEGPQTVTVYGPLSARDQSRHAYLAARCLDLTADWIGRY